MREAATSGGADWVIAARRGRVPGRPRGRCARRAGGIGRAIAPGQVDLRYYVPCPDDPVDDNVLRRIRHRRVDEGTYWTRKVIVPAARARDRRRSLSQGSHGLVDTRTGDWVPASFTDKLALAHFPVRSERQLARKVLGGWPAHVARPDRPARRRSVPMEARLRRGRVGAADGATAAGVRARLPDARAEGRPGTASSAFDPVPTRLELRYDVPPEPPPLEVLAETAVRSGRGAERRAGRRAPRGGALAHPTGRSSRRLSSAARTAMITERGALALRRFMLRTARSPLKLLWAGLYAAVARAVALIVAPRAHARTDVYLRGSLASGEPLYGLSDIDLVAVAAGRERSPDVYGGRFEALCRALPPLRGLMRALLDLRRAEPCNCPRRRLPGQRAR